MKFLIILIFLFLFVGQATSQSLFSGSSKTGFQDETQDYGKSFTYQYFVEPLISLDEKWESIIARCSILGEDLSQKLRTYNGLGSCLFDQITVLSDDDESRKNVVFHIDQLFDLHIQWEGLSVQDVLRSYTRKDPHGLSSEITLDLVGDENFVSGNLSFLLSEVLKSSSPEDENLIRAVSSVVLQNSIDVIFLKLVPYKKGLLKISLSFIDPYNVEFYTLEAITNYYPGADKYFVRSIDQHQEESDEK